MGKDPGADVPGGSYSTYIAEPSPLFPTAQCYASECSQVLSVLYDPLVNVDAETGDLIPVVAESVTTEDNTVWTVQLREDYTFHNGEPVNADAFIRAWNYSAYGPHATDTNFLFAMVEGYDAMNAEEGQQPDAKQLSGLEKTGEYSFEVTLSKPFSQFGQVLAYTPAFAAGTAECFEHIDQCNASPIGYGPYQIQGEWEHNEEIVVERYEDYGGERPANADEITFAIYADIGTAYRDWRAGSLDIVAPDAQVWPQAKEQAGDRWLEEPSSAFSYLGYPVYDEDWQDKKLRQALSLAIDRKEIISRLFNGLYIPAQGVIAPIVPGAREDACEYCTFDPEQAKRLYEESGGVPDNTVKLYFNAGAGYEDWVRAVGDQWSQVLGLDYELQSTQWAQYLELLTQFDLNGPYRLGWEMDYPSPENYLRPLYSEEGGSNYSQYYNEEFEELLDQAETAESTEVAIDLYQQAADIVLEEMPIIPLWFGKAHYVWSDDVENIDYSQVEGQIAFDEVQVRQ
ncbi:MAG TPA: ABC transporter substrate-binding protein [Nocardioidaceae bacterium]|nr:ABC transporter substrate-binding protein [Nocardioidaceae bacterium]